MGSYLGPAPPMVPVTLWPQLLLVVLILRQSAAVSDHCSQLQEEISRLERDIVSITELKHKNELRAGNCDEHLTKQILISQATSKELNKTVAVNNGLKKQFEVKEEVLKTINEKQTELHTAIDGLTKIVVRINQAVQRLFEKQEKLQTNIDDVAKTVESLNEMSQLLCELPKDVCRSLLDAAKSGDVDSAKRLVKCDSNDSCTDGDKHRNTPLTYAASNGHVEVVRVLLEGGANVDRAVVDENTALHRAAFKGHLDVCRLLLDWGAKVDRLNRWQHTPLHVAAREGHLSVVKLLVERGADVSVKGKQGYTALHDAERWGYFSVVKLLVERRADVWVKNENGWTASDLARLYEKKDVADWLDDVRRG